MLADNNSNHDTPPLSLSCDEIHLTRQEEKNENDNINRSNSV